MGAFGLNSNKLVSPGNEASGLSFIKAKVMSTILDESHPKWAEQGGWDALGAIEYLPFYAGLRDSTVSFHIAKPLYSNIKHYPLKFEIVWIIMLPDPSNADNPDNSSAYYVNIVNLWAHPHHNAFPDLNFSTLDSNLKLNYQEIESGQVKQQTSESNTFQLGNTFKERSNIKPLQPFEGDIIYEGRWGQSIRFGSTVKEASNRWSQNGNNGDPITIIRNGQSKILNSEGWIPTTEDINEDSTSIYFTDGQAIPIRVASKNLGSFGSKLQEAAIPIITTADNPVTPLPENVTEIEETPITSSVEIEKTPPPTPEVPQEVYNEEEIIFHFPGEDTQLFNFEIDRDEESPQISITPEIYDAKIIANEGENTKTQDNKYISYENNIPYVTDVEWFEGVRISFTYADVIKLLITQARKENIPLKINSGFRTWDEQYALRVKNVIDKTKADNPQYLRSEASDKFNPETARPGYSRHQVGKAFDLSTSNPLGYKWMVENASKYGFIRTVKTEHWHWEYIPNTDPFAYVKKDHESWNGLT